MFRRRVLAPLFHSRVVSRPAPPTEAFVNEPPSLHPSLLLNRASPYQSYITAKRSARERQKGGGRLYGRLQQCQHNAFPCTQRGEGCILHRLATFWMGLKRPMCSICILMKTVFHAAASELEQHGSPAARHGVVVVGGDGSVGISESRATSNMCSNCSSSIGGGGGEKPTTRRPSRRRE